MARRKAEATPDPATMARLRDGIISDTVRVMGASPENWVGPPKDDARRDTLDAIIARMAGLGGMTDRAALNVVAVSLAQLAEVLRDD